MNYILAIDDGKLPSRRPRKGEKALLVGVKMKKNRIEAIYCKSIEVDGLDVTEKTIEIILKAKPIDIILLSGISYAGFNIIDAVKIWEETGIPIVVISKEKPNNQSILSALKKHFEDWKVRWKKIEKVLEKSRGIHEVYLKSNKNPLYIETIGISREKAGKILKENTIWGRTPEPIRVANIIAKNISTTFYALKNKNPT